MIVIFAFLFFLGFYVGANYSDRRRYYERRDIEGRFSK